jgi:acetyl-CoA C-acetyltransferase
LAPASRSALKKAGLTINDIYLIEANKAFAAQSIAIARDLGFEQGQCQRRRNFPGPPP